MQSTVSPSSFPSQASPQAIMSNPQDVIQVLENQLKELQPNGIQKLYLPSMKGWKNIKFDNKMYTYSTL